MTSHDTPHDTPHGTPHDTVRREPTPRAQHHACCLTPLGDGPVLLVHGDRPTGSLRVLLDAPDVAAECVPPAHELVPDDVVHAQPDRYRRRADVVEAGPARYAATPEVLTR